MTKTIAELWNSYHKEVLPQDAPAIQVQECKRAFYAGARGLMTSIISNLSPGPDDAPEDLTMMEDIDKELQEFLISVIAGKN
jgi:hypothetical protein